MPLTEYDYDYRTSGNLAVKPKKKVVFDQDVAEAWMKKPNSRDFYEDKYKKDFEMVYERMNINRQKSTFDYEVQAQNTVKRTYKTKPEAINLDETEEALEEQLKEKEAQKIERKQKREIAFKRFRTIVLFTFLAAIALFICYRYSIINEKFNQVEKLKKELAANQTINEQLQADIDSETDISYIENFAKYQLGMQKPQQSQMVYINIDKKDKIFTPVKIEEDLSERTWVDDVVEKIANIFE